MCRGLPTLWAIVAICGCDRRAPPFDLTADQRAAVRAAIPTLRPKPAHHAGVEWDDAIRLIGWQTQSETPSPGDRFDLTLAWESRRRVIRDWEVHMRLRPSLPGLAKYEAVLDHHAVGGLHPISQWRPGQFIVDTFAVRLHDQFPPGPARLVVGLQQRNRKRGPVDVGRLEIRPPTELVLHLPGRSRWRIDDATVVWAQWHGEGLTFGFELRDADPWNPLTGRDAELWTYDAVELFLDVDESDPAYVELQVSPTGALFDAAFEGHRSDLAIAQEWDSHADVFAEVTPEGWRAELFIPWSSLPNRDLELSPLRANLYRLDRDRNGRRSASAWSGPGSGDFHDQRRWGRLLLAP